MLAIGDPFGVGQTVTSGIVSALARTQVGISDYQFFIQTDAAINPGNSGGALIDMNGRLVGINTAIFSRTGGSNGIGFAIPSNMVRVVADSARERRPCPAALDRRRAPGGDARDRRGARHRPRRAARWSPRSSRTARRRRPGSTTGDLDHLGRRRRDRRPEGAQLPPRHQGHRRDRQARHHPRRQGISGDAGARGGAGDRAARRGRDHRRLALRRRDGAQPLAGGRRGAGLSRPAERRHRQVGRPMARPPQQVGLPPRRRHRRRQRPRDRVDAPARRRVPRSAADIWDMAIERGGRLDQLADQG